MELRDIETPDILRYASVGELETLSDDIRSFLIRSISRTGGHLSSNLGLVEATVALHSVFESPKDKIIFDVGHQCYTHKLLTGRMKGFPTLRQINGLSGFQKRSESEHDPWEAGHASTALSAAIGMAAARDLKHEEGEIIAVVGDGSIGGGLTLEALNDLGASGRKVIVVFNDNNMSISRNHSGLETSLTRFRASQFYQKSKADIHQNLGSSPLGKGVLQVMHRTKESLKHSMLQDNFFTQFNLDYVGPVDGHDIHALKQVFELAKDHKGPIVVHIVTTKGKGYPYAEKDKDGSWHGVGPFSIETGRPLASKAPNEASWSKIIADYLSGMAASDPTICAITPAMATGSCLLNFAKTYPDRFFDVGIAEEHAVTMAGGMAVGGLKPFVSIYSSFLQRAYDEVMHDVARMDLPVVFGIDRAGLVGEDGETHQGIYDVAFLRTIPGFIIAQPCDAYEAADLMETAFKTGKPFGIRYPRGKTKVAKGYKGTPVKVGSWTKTVVGEPKQAVIAYGPDVRRIIKKARANKTDLMVVNARFLSPIDTDMLDEIFAMNIPVTVYETDVKEGGLSTAIREYLDSKDPKFDALGIENHFVKQGSIPMLRKQEGISLNDLFERLEDHETR